MVGILSSKLCSSMISIWLFILASFLVGDVAGFRVLNPGELTPNASYFRPYDQGFVGRYGDPSNLQRERVNEGAFETSAKELFYEGVSPRQACPGMVGPFSDGNFYCTAKEFGYCDKRSGACFCNTGYVGIDCSDCHGSHYKVGTLCVPKSLCPDDCNGAGACDFYDGTCHCQEHRSGVACEIKLCTSFSPLCETCTSQTCLRCKGGYYLTGDAAVCSTCYDFDPRCAGCTKEVGCTVCADPLLTSVRRSGYRNSDPVLPLEEASRELSITLPFGTKSIESFAEAEHYFVAPEYSAVNPLKDQATSCVQGTADDESWVCSPVVASHVVCGHFGVFKFGYPNYIVNENVPSIRLSVSRSGGGYGTVSVSYYINHITTNDSDVSATAIYTTSQKLTFEEGVVERSFLINIQDDNLVEENEVFQVVLEVPEGGGSVGPQFRTNVTIIDDDSAIFSSSKSYLVGNTTRVKAGSAYSVKIQAADAKGQVMTMGGEQFLAVVENGNNKWVSPGTPTGTQRHSLRKQVTYSDSADGTYFFSDNTGIKEQGNYELRAWHAFPGGLKGQYYYDGFFDKLALERQDRVVNFTWGYGKIAPSSIDYVTIRWSGVLKAEQTAEYYFKVEADDHARLWLDGELILDHWHEMYAKLEPSRKISLVADQLYELVLEYRDVRGEAHCRLLWGTSSPPTEVVPSSALFGLYELSNLSPTIVTVLSGATDPTKSECTGDGLFTATSDISSHFKVFPRDSYYNLRDDDDEWYLASEYFSATAVLTSQNGHDGVGAEEITAEFVYNHDEHCFEGTYKALQAGNYDLNIYFQADRDAVKAHVAGSPFALTVSPTSAFGPHSIITSFTTPSLVLDAGVCHIFYITSRDINRNLLLAGGDDYIAYSYQIDFSSNTDNVLHNALHNSTHAYVRYGTVTDNADGTYNVEICPVLQGTHEMHVLLQGVGVSNQPYRLEDFSQSENGQSARGTYQGQYVHESPYNLVVNHAASNGFTSTAEGNGLVDATVGVPSYILITVRDAWDNVLISTSHAPTVTAVLDRSPSAAFSVSNLNNGSFMLEYTPKMSGSNLISVYVDGVHIKDSPFTVPILDGRPSQTHSIASGPGFLVGIAGVASYFQVHAYDLEGNRRTTSGDIYEFNVTGENNLQGFLEACPKPPAAVTGVSHPICDEYDLELGHYWGTFTPLHKGTTQIDVFLNSSTHQILSDPVVRTTLVNSPWAFTVHPGQAAPQLTDIDGDIYDTIAGSSQTMLLKARDLNSNLLNTGGYPVELVMYAVASEWGTVQPWNTTPGLPNEYHYKGFYSGDQDFYGDLVDHQDGTYTITHNATYSGIYVSRYSMAVPGLNATYFNTTDTFGYLTDENHNPASATRFEAKNDNQPANLGSSISWTGDIGGRPYEGNSSDIGPGVDGGRGGLGLGSYYHMFKSRMEENVDFNLTVANANREIGYDLETKSAFSRAEKFREQYWSARYTGMITPTVSENFNFKVTVDGGSTVRLILGGRGTAFNGSYSDPGQVVLTIGKTIANSADVRAMEGSYNFTDSRSREFVLEYVHNDGESFMKLEWESPSTPLQTIPASAFSRWVNISHFNTTVHPAVLSPIHSTAYGAALTQGTVGHLHSFQVYARDQYRNLRQVGGEVPSMVVVGSDGAMFRGNVTDYGNSTYKIEYYATVAGDFRMYVTVGCCPSHPNVGLAAEIRDFHDKALLIEGAPFPLTVSAGAVAPHRVAAVGTGVLGSVAGELQTFSILLRDVHSNPTSLTETEAAAGATLVISLVDVVSGSVSDSKTVDISHSALTTSDTTSLVSYNVTHAGEYFLNVHYKADTSLADSTAVPVMGSPFNVRVVPAKADAARTLCRGIGLRQAAANRSYSFEVQLFDAFDNNLITGGDKLFVRLRGARGWRNTRPVLPDCRDTFNGRYRCAYVAIQNGSHELDVRLLNASTNQPGGLGLAASYYASPTPGARGSLRINLTDPTDSSPLGELEKDTPYSQRIDARVAMSWPNGYILPILNYTDNVLTGQGSDSEVAAMRALGQSVLWEGYVVPPRTDDFQFELVLERMLGSVYIDEELVYDSELGIQLTVSLQANAAYAIRVEAAVSVMQLNAPVAVQLRWKTPIYKWSIVPSFYLFDSAGSVQLSPFPVNVGGPRTSVHSPP